LIKISKRRTKIMLYKKKPSKLVGRNHSLILKKSSKKLIIFFKGTNNKSNLFDFYDIGNRFNENVLFINNGNDEWYQNGIPSLETSTVEETVDLLKDWINYMNVEEVYTCGTFMGAYGAILYGSQLGARVLAFNPELELKLDGSRSLSHMIAEQSINHNIFTAIKTNSNNINIYVGEDDPVDVYHASKVHSFAEYPNINVFFEKEKDHNLVTHLEKKELLFPLINDFLYNKELSNIFKDDFITNAGNINGFANDYYQQYKFFKIKEWETSIEYGLVTTSHYPTNSYAQYMLGVSYAQTGKLEQALSHLSMARSLVPLKLDYQFAVANCLRRMGHIHKARYLHQKILQANKNYARSHYDLSLIYSKMKDHEGAIARAKNALKLQKNNKSYKARVSQLSKV